MPELRGSVRIEDFVVSRRGRGRPPHGDKARKTKISIRFTDDEYDKAIEKAGPEPVAGWIRRLVLQEIE